MTHGEMLPVVEVWVVSQSGVVLRGVCWWSLKCLLGACAMSQARRGLACRWPFLMGPVGLSKPRPTSPWVGGFAKFVWGGVLPIRIGGALKTVKGPIIFGHVRVEGTLRGCPRQTRSLHFGLWQGAGWGGLFVRPRCGLIALVPCVSVGGAGSALGAGHDEVCSRWEGLCEQCRGDGSCIQG